ncbi:MAG: hypothetical protein ACKE5Q_00090 [Methylophilaceae bacterium]
MAEDKSGGNKSGGNKSNQQPKPSQGPLSEGNIGGQKSNPTNNDGNIRSDTTTGSTGPKIKTVK